MAELTAHTYKITRAGAAIARTGAAIHQGWQALGAVYRAPEADQLVAATGPVMTVSASVGEDLQEAAATLRDYAADAAVIQARLEALRLQATDLVAAYAAAQDESTTVTLDDRSTELSAGCPPRSRPGKPSSSVAPTNCVPSPARRVSPATPRRWPWSTTAAAPSSPRADRPGRCGRSSRSTRHHRSAPPGIPRACSGPGYSSTSPVCPRRRRRRARQLPARRRLRPLPRQDDSRLEPRSGR
jgi:hypothetical protein